jgi:hypothetical protein
MLKPNELPAPDALIEYPDGAFGPLMFHFALEGHDLMQIAREQGFELRTLSLDHDNREETAPLRDRAERLFDDDAHMETLVADWTPPDLGDGWKIAAKWDTEDGPVAIYLRPQAKAAAA